MTVFEIAILAVLGFICVFALVDRVCKCVEHCSYATNAAKSVTNINKKEGESDDK